MESPSRTRQRWPRSSQYGTMTSYTSSATKSPICKPPHTNLIMSNKIDTTNGNQEQSFSIQPHPAVSWSHPFRPLLQISANNVYYRKRTTLQIFKERSILPILRSFSRERWVCSAQVLSSPVMVPYLILW